MTDASPALAAYRRFFEGFNSRRAEAWAGALHFPHVRVSGRGPVNVVPTMEDHVAAMSWNRVEASGWHHTTEQPPVVVHSGPQRAHIAGGWTRYTEDNQPILTSYITYVVTRISDEWGIQSRFAVDPGPEGLTDEHVSIAKQVVTEYLALWNAKRFTEAAGKLNYPAVQVHPGRLVVWNSAEDHVKWLEDQPWREIVIDEVRVVQAGPNAVNLALSLREGHKTSDALVLVTLRDGHWGFQAESTVE